MDNYLKSLLTLLEDEDDNIARMAIISLLDKYENELDFILKELQENSNPQIRRRCHQIQSFISINNRRNDLQEYIHEKDSNLLLIDALISLHLLWFDQDSYSELKKLVNDFLAPIKLTKLNILEDLREVMINNEFITLDERSNDSELYTIGSALDSKHGSESFWITLLLAIAEIKKIDNIEAIKVENHFYLRDKISNKILSLGTSYEITQCGYEPSKIEVLSKQKIFKYLTTITFGNAVNNDDFRYIQILGAILANSENGTIGFMPYPYGRKRK